MLLPCPFFKNIIYHIPIEKKPDEFHGTHDGTLGCIAIGYQ